MTAVDTTDGSTPAGRLTGVSAPFCDRCGQPAAGAQHASCATARALEPPRFCAACSRRMVVQITPVGWSARCSEHGTLQG